MTYRWDPIIRSIAHKRASVADNLGIDIDEMLAVGRVAARDAEESWDPEGGRSLRSWIYLQVDWDLGDLFRREVRQLAEELNDEELLDDLDVETVVLVRQALECLQAHLPRLDFVVLWLAHAEGWTCREIAEAYGLRINAVEQKLSRARKKAVRILRPDSIAEIGATYV